MCLFTSARTVAIVFARSAGSEAMYCAGVLTFDGGFMDSSSFRTKCHRLVSPIDFWFARHPGIIGGRSLSNPFAVTQPVGLPLERRLVARPDDVVRSTDRRRRGALAAGRPRDRYHPHAGWDRR